MLAYASMLLHYYYAQNYASIIRQGLLMHHFCGMTSHQTLLQIAHLSLFL